MNYLKDDNTSGEMLDPALEQKARDIYETLLEFYGEPTWRDPLPPVAELVSTILSQNTNDANRDAAFYSLKARFPDWESVRDAETDEVIEAIRTAGLANQKGPRIQKVLQQITEERGSLDLDFLKEMPTGDVRTWLLQFNGVGPKTAAIVMQFSLEIPAFPVDTHIYRVTKRLGLLPEKMNEEQAHDHLAALFKPEWYYTGHLNIIRLGREICIARKPKCVECPLRKICDYYQEQKQKSEG
jgi:endonuclease III